MADLLRMLKQSELELLPLTIRRFESSTPNFDFGFEIIWRKQTKLFLPYFLTLPTPKNIEQKIYFLRGFDLPGHFPLIITTFLNEENLQRLIEAEISGIDLCGNGVIIANEWFIYRSGAKNKFPAKSAIKNIYRGASSLIGRTLLLKNEFENASGILSEIEKRGGKTTLPTVSKVLKELENELIVNKSDGVKLINPNIIFFFYLTRL